MLLLLLCSELDNNRTLFYYCFRVVAQRRAAFSGQCSQREAAVTNQARRRWPRPRFRLAARVSISELKSPSLTDFLH